MEVVEERAKEEAVRPMKERIEQKTKLLPLKKPLGEILNLIISRQQFNGSWEISIFPEISSLNVDQVNQLRPEFVTPVIWGTAIIVALLENRFTQERDIWEMVVRKSKIFLRDLGKSKLEELFKLAKQFSEDFRDSFLF